MGSDNVDIFKKVIFSIPSFQKILAGIFLFGIVYSIFTYFGLKAFTAHQIFPVTTVFIAFFIFILPTVVLGELLHLTIPAYPRKWGYFLAWCNQLILFIFSMIMTGANNFGNAWSILWIALISLFLSSSLVLLLTLGYNYIKKIVPLSLVQPLFILAAFHYFVGAYIEIPIMSYLINIGVAVAIGIVLIISAFILEFLMASNLSRISVIGLISGLLQKRQEELNIGYPTRPDVQTLVYENEEGEATVAIPWIHPGPLEGFGGGKITSKIIDSLNRDGQGFFFHVPSTHKSDPSSPKDYRKILDAMEEPEKAGKASRLITEDYGEVKFHGRKIDGKNLVFLDPSDSDNNFDDYEVAIFQEIIDPEETVIVDLHSHSRELIGEREELWYNTEAAERYREHFKDFLEKLDEEKTFDYFCGFEVNPENTKIFSVVEEVEGQKTLLLGIEENEKGDELAQVEKKYGEEFDKVITFTTDTHRSIHDMSKKEQVDPGRLVDNVEKTKKNVSKGKIGFSSSEAESMKLLQEDYLGLIYSINIIVRLGILMLLFIYLGLIIWVW